MKRLIIGILFLTSACASANRSAVRDIDRFVETTLREVPDMPSVGVAVVQDGDTVYLKNADVPYYIGSTTKAYTGLATAILAQRGLIDLDAPISKYLPTTVNVTRGDDARHRRGAHVQLDQWRQRSFG